jgi:hypothetical protein
VGDVGKPGPRAPDLRALGTRRLTSAEWAHPDIEFVVAGGPDPGSWAGRAAMAGAWRDRLGPVEDARAVAEE